MSDEPIASLAALKNALRERHPDVRPYGEDDADWTWADEGMELMEAGDYGMAALKFEELICSQPDESDGYEGLALVYQALGRSEEALLLIKEAVRLARQHVEKGYMDREVLEEILEEQDAILNR